jgi:hypothetical protein
MRVTPHFLDGDIDLAGRFVCRGSRGVHPRYGDRSDGRRDWCGRSVEYNICDQREMVRRQASQGPRALHPRSGAGEHVIDLSDRK